MAFQTYGCLGPALMKLLGCMPPPPHPQLAFNTIFQLDAHIHIEMQWTPRVFAHMHATVSQFRAQEWCEQRDSPGHPTNLYMEADPKKIVLIFILCGRRMWDIQSRSFIGLATGYPQVCKCTRPSHPAPNLCTS